MRRKLIIVVSALVLIVGVSVGIIFAVKRSPALQNTVLKLANTTTVNTNTAVTNTPTNIPAAVSPDRATIQFVARNFTERFGSGSSENNGSNLVEAELYGTKSYNDYLDKQVAKLKANPTTTYTGTITRALVFSFVKLNANNASVVVSTQQATTVGNTTTNTNRDLVVDLVKVGTDWKVNAAAWK